MVRARETTAAKQYLGFSLQVNRALWHLLRAEPGDLVSLEVLGDVAVTSDAGLVKTEEMKSHAASNPVADRSVELWKTFGNWIDAIAAGVLDPERTRFFLFTSGPFEGAFLKCLTDASTPEEADEAINFICTELWGPAPYFPHKKKVARKLRPHLQRVFSPAGREAMRCILPRFTYQWGSKVPSEEMLSVLRTKVISPEILEDVLLHILGWVKDQTDQIIASGRPAYIDERDFYRELSAFVRRIGCSFILASLAPPPTTEEIQEHLATSAYITQLDLIEASYEDKLAAISDHKRAEIDRIDWAVRGWVHPSTFNDVERELILAWRSYQTRVDVGHKERPEIDRGKLLYADCSLHKIPVQGNDAPAHFTRGSFHALADDLSIGWHPNYRSLLRPKGES